MTIDCGSALSLPHDDRSIDVVMIFGVFALIFDNDVRRGIAREAMRVVKDDGVILSCDFQFKASDRNMRALGRRELRRLYAGMRIEGHPIHPLPPLLRKIGPHAPFMCNVIAMVPFIRTHYFATITKSSQ